MREKPESNWINHITWMREKKRGPDHPLWDSIEVICENCGKKFFRRKSAIRRHTFCSTKCSDEYARTNPWNAGENNPMHRIDAWNKGLTKETDPRVLRGALKVKQNHPSKTDPNFGKKISLALTGKYIGEKSFNWRGGYKSYYGRNWHKQRRLALRRDKYSCRICGINELELKHEPSVHHIIPFRVFGLDRYKEANDLENLITLCPGCHSEYERKTECLKGLATVG